MGAIFAAMLVAGLPAALAQVDDFDPEIFVDVGNAYAPEDLKVDRPAGGNSSGSDDGRDGLSGSYDGRDGLSVTGRSGRSTDGEDGVVSSPSPSPTRATTAARTSRSSTVSPPSAARRVIPDIAPLVAVNTGASPGSSPTPKGSGSAGGSIGSGEGTSAGAPGGAAGPASDESAAKIARTGGFSLIAVALFAFLTSLGLLLRKEDPSLVKRPR